ncbi:thioredoxin fold domain-containing protein [Haloferula chungangensis]|uniref:Thioredoxin fold domain-containing protein n=1 Tax=Haloferula chungangensis TaxID=1048331 RepID=A0ABW2L0M1_9BACT
MIRRLSWLSSVLILASCGTSEDPFETEPNPFGATGIPAALRRGDGQGGTPIAPGGISDEMKNNPGVVLDPNEIVYTDPDAEDPDSLPTELDTLLSEAPQEGPWSKSYTNVFKRARREDKPVLIWFTDSQNSVNCKMLSQELFGDVEFEEWAEETFVRLQVDSRVSGDNGDEVARRKDYVQELKKRFKVLGTPMLVVLTPAEDVIMREKGYVRGQANFKWGQLRQAAEVASKKHQAWKSKMEKKGYRTWKDPRGRKIFAKLVAYKDGELVIVEPDGTRARTKEKNLSPADQDWIAQQKRARGIE